MLTVDQALAKILDQVEALEAEDKPILNALGQVLAEDIRSTVDIPPLDNSAMDGYAVQAASTSTASPSAPVVLRVVDEVAAGYVSTNEVGPDSAIRIMTGAPIPVGADAVVQFENSDEVRRREAGQPTTEIGILRPASPGLNIRRAGEDIAAGSLVLKKGIVLHPQEIGVLASLGREVVSVIRRPVVAILATGDELVEVGHPLPPGKIYNSNTFSLAAQVLKYGGIPQVLGIAQDVVASLREKIDQGLDADLLLTSAGVSVGEYDVVKDVLAEMGEVSFWTVKMRPGKPLAFGVLGQEKKRVPHIGLPGNPVSSMVAFEQFARPAILKMLGKRRLEKPTIWAESLERIENEGGFRRFIRVVVRKRRGQYVAALTGPQGSGMLTSMAEANGLLVVPENVAVVKPGDKAQVQMLDWSEE